MSAEPFAVKLEKMSGRDGPVTFESLVYPRDQDDGSPCYRVSRLTVRGYGFQYAVFGHFGAEGARDLAPLLPPATRELHGLKLTAGVCAFRGGAMPGVALGLLATADYHLRVDDPGESALRVGDVYEPLGLGEGKPLADSRTRFPDHEAARFYRSRTVGDVGSLAVPAGM